MLHRKRKYTKLNKTSTIYNSKKEIMKLISHSTSETYTIILTNSANPIFYNNSTNSKLLFTITPINNSDAYIRTYREIPLKISRSNNSAIYEIHKDSLIVLKKVEEITIATIIENHNIIYFNFNIEISKIKKKELRLFTQNTQDISLINEELTLEDSYNYEREDIATNKCNICLEYIQNRKEGILNECMHSFCYLCILKWSKYSSECPICKKNFSKVLYDGNVNNKGQRAKKKMKSIRKKKFLFNYDEDDELNDDIVEKASDYCLICGKDDNRGVLLICDKCTFNVCHTYCDGLDRIPDGVWYCKKCRRKMKLKKRKVYS